MDRRTLLRGLGALAGGGAFAGCTGANREVPVTAPPAPSGVGTEASGRDGGAGGGTPGRGDGRNPNGETDASGSLAQTNFGVGADGSGNLRITVTVRNEGTTTEPALVRVDVALSSGEQTRFGAVTLAPGESTTLVFDFDEPESAFDGLSTAVLNRTPATPLGPGAGTPAASGQTETATAEGTTTDSGTATADGGGGEGTGTAASGTPGATTSQ